MTRRPTAWTRVWAPALVYAVILTLSSRSSDDLPDLPGWVSYLGHAVEYAALAASVRWAATPRGWRRPALATVAVVAVLAVLDEVVQSTVPGRDPSVLDLLVDVAAATAVVALWRPARRRGATDAT